MLQSLGCIWFRVEDLGFMRCRAYVLAFRVWDLRFRIYGCGLRDYIGWRMNALGF